MNFKFAAVAAVVLLFCIVIVQSEAQVEDYPIANTTNGLVQGRLHYTLFYRNPYYAYKGIPFGKPPVGELRFKPPQPADPWEGIFNASTFGNICIQSSSAGSEDCLTLNVYVPAYVPRVDLPVLVGIYGGSFSDGQSESLGPDFLFNQDSIILVTMNYRLGPIGFLSLNTSEYSGNMGLKDQLLAIKWVNDNIRYFGGDTDRITLYGISAGAASAHYHVLSPASQGLFHRAIMSSGVAINPWSITRADHLPVLFDYAARNGNPVQNVDQLIEYLKVLNVRDLVAQTGVDIFEAGSGRLQVDIFWGPRVETADAIEPFFVDSPADILANNFTSNVDTLFGFASAESYLFINEELINTSLLQPFDERFELGLPLYPLNFDLDFESEQFRNIQPIVRDFYFGHNEGRVNRTTLFEYSQLVSDLSFVYGIDHAVKIHAASSNGRTFYFRFSVEGLFNVLRWITAANILGLPGATHGDDVFYAFGTDGALSALYNILPATSMERRVLNEYSRFYTNFIAYGTPTPEGSTVQLEEVRPGEINFADFTNERIVIGRDPFGSHMQFWDELIAEHFA